MALDEAQVAGASGWPDALAGLNLTDAGNAERLVAEHGDDIRYVPGLGWHAWDGQRWRPDDSGELIRRALATVRRIHERALQLDDDQKQRRQLIRHALDSEAERKLRSMVSLAATIETVIVRPEELDRDPDVLNVENGTLYLTVGEIVDHNRAALLTKLAPVRFDHGATAPTWEAFLDRALAGDADLIQFVQRAVGYSLTGRTSEQVVFLLHGSGANGKTTFLETLRALVGEYGQQTPAETFLERRETIPSDLARLRGARFVAAVETPEGRRLNETMVKRMVGSDTMAARFMHRDWFEFTPVFKAWLATNHLPVIRGTDEAIWRRIRLIPFTATIPDRERDRDLPQKLQRELPGILRWAADGAEQWYQRGLDPPAAVLAATSSYRADMDVLSAFLDDRCVLLPGIKTKAADLYGAYTDWARATGERDILSQRAFGLRLAERGLEQLRTKHARLWDGIGLRYDDTAPGVTDDA